MGKDNIKTDFRETGCEDVKCFEMSQDVIQWHAFQGSHTKISFETVLPDDTVNNNRSVFSA
jgi:hypothetical protein